jgi:hypothetical protein
MTVSQVKKYGPVQEGKSQKIFCRKAQVVGRNLPDDFRPEYCFHVRAISGVFLKDVIRSKNVAEKSDFENSKCRILEDEGVSMGVWV